MRPWPVDIDDGSSLEMEELISGMTNAKWLFVCLGVMLALNALGMPPFWYCTVSVAAVLGGFGFLSVWQYERDRQSLSAMYGMMHGAGISLALFLPTFAEEAARRWASNYWLYEDYLYVYCAIYVAILLSTAMWLKSKAKEHMAMLSAATAEGTITAHDLFNVITRAKGAREALRKSSPSSLAPIMGLTATAMAVSGFWHGKDGMLYICFLLSLLLSPFLVGLMLLHRFELHRYLGRRDVTILF